MATFLIIIVILFFLLALIGKISNDVKTTSKRYNKSNPITKPKYERKKEVSLNFSKNINALPYCIIFDTETTGLIEDKTIKPTIANLKSNDSNFPKIVQISWSLFSREKEIISEGNYYIKQNQPIPEEAIKIHNITNEICEEKGIDLKEALLKFQSDCSEAKAIVAHNLSFDKHTIEAEFIRLGLKKPFTNKNGYDTVKMGQNVMQQRKYPTLEELCIFLYGEEVKQHLKSHDSFYDLFFTANCFFTMKSITGTHWNK